MFRKIFFLLTIMSTLTVHAQAPLNQVETLKKAYDELSFSLEVEWDGENNKFYSKKLSEFQKTVEKLQENGMTNAELLEFAKRNVKDKNLAKDLDNLFSSVKTQNMTASEARQFVIEYIGKNYASGASWSGSVIGATVLVALLIALVVVAAAGGSDSRGGSGSCYDEYVCYDYYDDFGFYWYTDCYWETYCY